VRESTPCQGPLLLHTPEVHEPPRGIVCPFPPEFFHSFLSRQSAHTAPPRPIPTDEVADPRQVKWPSAYHPPPQMAPLTLLKYIVHSCCFVSTFLHPFLLLSLGDFLKNNFLECPFPVLRSLLDCSFRQLVHFVYSPPLSRGRYGSRVASSGECRIFFFIGV